MHTHDKLLVYCFDKEGRYTGTDTADPDPLTPGEYLLPARCTTVQPPNVDHYGQSPFWLGDRWEVLRDDVKIEMDAKAARQIRDRLLKWSDWTQLGDCPLGPLERLQWSAYRQKLRNMPEHHNWPYVEFPTPPEKEVVKA